MKTMHAFTAPEAIRPLAARLPAAAIPAFGAGRGRDHHQLREPAPRDPAVPGCGRRKLRLIYEAVDHDLFKPGDAAAARAQVASYGVTKPFVLFVSSLWQYKNCDGLLRAWALARGELGDRQLAIVGAGRDEKYLASAALARG